MPRIKGSGSAGPVRSLRLPRELDAWFEDRLRENPRRGASDLLLELLHGGLRLRHGYMLGQYRALARLIERKDRAGCDAYLSALLDTFGTHYVEHIKKWLSAEGLFL